MEKVKLLSVMGAKEGPTIILTVPRQDDEHCSITLEPIGEPPLALQFPPLSSNPLLTCAEMEECGHRFNAMALIAHFARNSMTCPMCRAGLANNPMDVCASFPNESWTTAPLLTKFTCTPSAWNDDYHDESEYDSDHYLIGGLGSTTFSMIIPVNVHEMSMFVVFIMFRAPLVQTAANGSDITVDEPCVRLQCPLVFNQTSGTYELSATSKRQISTIISEMRVQSISASIFARHARLFDDFGTFPLSSMRATRLSNDMTIELVNSTVDSHGSQPSPHLSISVQMADDSSDSNAQVNISEFIYTPPQMAFIRRLLLAGG